MTDAAIGNDALEAPKKGKKPLLFGLLGALFLGGAGFYAVYSGLLLTPKTDSSVAHDDGHGGTTSSVLFVEMPPLTISLGNFANARHLRFHGHLEVTPGTASEVNSLMPRILDVLNTYLRAVGESELEDPASMNRVRAQMLRRVQVVVGEDKVLDLLITEFVLN